MKSKGKKLTKTLETGVKSNKQLWKDTCKQMDRYKNVPSKKLSSFEASASEQKQRQKHIEVKVFHEDILSTLEAVLANGFRPLVINTCGENFPLDAVKSGAFGKEYDVLRRTNYYSTIAEETFPLKVTDAIYSPEIYLFKTKEGRTIQKPKKYAMLSMCPIRTPRLISIRNDGKSQDNYESPQDEKIMSAKIKTMFDIAIEYGYDCILLSDFGCGKEKNPIDKILSMFNENIQRGLIKYVFFAVQNESNIKKDEAFLNFHKHIDRELKTIRRPKTVKFSEPLEPVKPVEPVEPATLVQQVEGADVDLESVEDEDLELLEVEDDVIDLGSTVVEEEVKAAEFEADEAYEVEEDVVFDDTIDIESLEDLEDEAEN